jgi:hypothetical protein
MIRVNGEIRDATPEEDCYRVNNLSRLQKAHTAIALDANFTSDKTTTRGV